MPASDDKFRVLRKLPEVRFEEELRGYSKSQVDRVLQGLAPLAEDVALLQQRLSDAEGRAAAAEARLLEAQTAAASSPTAPVDTTQPAAVSVATPPPNFDETLSKTLLLAQRTADQTVAEARAEAADLVDRARAESQSLAAENAQARQTAAAAVEEEKRKLLEAAHADVQARIRAAEASLTETEGAQRDALVAEIGEHVAVRDQLVADIERLEGHLAQRRETIRTALADMAVIVDDPSQLHSEMPLVVEELDAPDPSSGSVVLEVDGVGDLVSDVSVPQPEPAPAAQPAQAAVLGELGDRYPNDGHSGEPTAAVPMVELLADDPDEREAAEQSSHDQRAQSWPDEPAVDIAGDSDLDAVVDFQSPAADAGNDELDLALDDWGNDSPVSPEPPASSVSGEVVVDQVPWNEGLPGSVKPADFGFEDAVDRGPSGLPERRRSSEEQGRPEWADSVPDAESPQVLTQGEDPFLDELRRATGDDAETDVALERFLTEDADDADRRSGWFGRRK